MSDPRKATTTLHFNGSDVSAKIKPYLESVTYEDVASGSSDTISIKLHNINEKWLNAWYPSKGDTIAGRIKFLNWNKDGKDLYVACGNFTLDEITFNGNPMTAEFGGVSAPVSESFSTRDRSKTWKSVTIKQIAKKIAKRYGMSLVYKAGTVRIAELEQSESDSDFLYGTCEDYGLSMKVYKKKIVIYNQTTLEKRSAVAVLKPTSFEDGDWTLTDGIYGTYTGAKISYTKASTEKEISVYIGFKKESASKNRILRIDESCDSASEAYRKAAAQVNLSNQEATTLSGTIWPNPKVCAGVTVRLSGFGELSGKYFIDKSTITVEGDGGTSQQIEAHKCQKRLKLGSAVKS